MKRRTQLVFGLTLTAFFRLCRVAYTQDPITNFVSIPGGVCNSRDCVFPQAALCELSVFQPQDVWFLDFETLTNAVAAITNSRAKPERCQRNGNATGPGGRDGRSDSGMPGHRLRNCSGSPR